MWAHLSREVAQKRSEKVNERKRKMIVQRKKTSYPIQQFSGSSIICNGGGSRRQQGEEKARDG